MAIRARKATRGPKRPSKAHSISKLKKELDRVFSLYIRHRDAIDGICYCYTCNRPMEIKKAQAGHFVPRIYLATRWDESNVKSQCAGCNIWGRGQLLDFEENLIEELGVARVQQLKDKRNEIWKLDRAWYEERITFYANKV